MFHSRRAFPRQAKSYRGRALVIAAAALLTASTATSAAAASPNHPAPTVKPTIVLVHGAWADSGAWDGVVTRLLDDNYPVDVFPTPLQSLSGDSAALRTFLDSITGPIVVVGHSYGGAVVTDATQGDASVKALVYLDAFAPAAGENVLSLVGPDSAVANPDPTQVFNLVPAGPPTPTTQLYVRTDVFPGAFANDLPRYVGRVLAATQRPVAFGALLEPSTTPAWSTIPSWYEVGTRDRVIPPAQQLSMAQRAGAHIVRADTSHLPMISQPGTVTRTIETAATASR